jgi:hypothetical protein
MEEPATGRAAELANPARAVDTERRAAGFAARAAAPNDTGPAA